MKRGQVGLFFIIGLVIVVIVGIVYFLVVPSFIQEEDNSADIVKTYVESCVETSIHEGNYELGKSGGYYVPPLNSLGDVPYYLINKQKTIPSITKREKDLGEYVKMALPICLDNFEIFENEIFSVEFEEEIDLIVEINEKFVEVDLEFPLKIYREETVISLNDFFVQIENGVPYQGHSLAKMIVDETSSEGICINCFDDFILENDFFVTTIPSEEKIFISIRSNGYLINGRNYELRFYLEL